MLFLGLESHITIWKFNGERTDRKRTDKKRKKRKKIKTLKKVLTIKQGYDIL